MGRYQEGNKENAILKAAEEELMEKGFDGTRTTEIARRAGVTHAMVHYYFHTKEELFDRVLQDKINEFIQTIPPVLMSRDMPVPERIEQAVRTHFDMMKANPLLPRFVVNELVSHPKYLYAMQQRVFEAVKSTLAELQADFDKAHEHGEIGQIDVVALLFDIISVNIFPFMVLPALQQLFSFDETGRGAFLEQRKEESVTLIMKRIATHTNIIK